MKKHIDVIERMMFCFATSTVDKIRIQPTLRAAKEALEKQIPKKPLQACGHNTNRTMNFCPVCGQALDWSDHPTEKGGGE